MKLLFTVVLLTLLSLECRQGIEFFYTTFNSTEGLRFNGDASTTDFGCSQALSDEVILRNQLGEQNYFEEEVPRFECSLDEDTFFKHRYRISNYGWDVLNVSRTLHSFLALDQESFFHEDRKHFCGLKLQLTAPKSNQVGSIFRNSPVEAKAGFTTWFSFGTPNSTEVCFMKGDVEKNCWIDGAEGFSFVLHSDDTKEEALGVSDKGLGVEDMTGALVIAFDTHFDVERDDIPHDTMTVFASKVNQQINLKSKSRLIDPIAMVNRNEFAKKQLQEDLSFELFQKHAKKLNVTIGKEHFVKIEYFPFINVEFLDYFSLTEEGRQFLKEEDEIGTLVIYVDNVDPAIALLVNFDAIFNDKEIYAGFTASTGKVFSRHLIYSWRFVETL